MDRSLRALQRRDPSHTDRVALAAGYLRRGAADAALQTLGPEPPPVAEAERVHTQAWSQVLGGLQRLASHRVVGRRSLLGVAAGHLVLQAQGPGGRWAWWPLDPSGRNTPVAVQGPFTPLLCAPQGLLMAVHAAPLPAWFRPPAWEIESLVDGSVDANGLGEVSPDGAQAAWPQGVFALPGLERLAPPPDGADGWRVAWASDLAVWTAGPRVHTQPLGGGAVARWEPAAEWRRRHPAQAASAPAPEALELTILRDGRVSTTAPLAVHDPRTGQTWFPNRGDGSGLSGPARLSLDGQALLLFRGARPCRLPLSGALPPLPRPPGASGLWHPVAACALVREAPQGPARLLDVHGRQLFRFPHGLRPVCWTPDGRGVVLQRELGASAGPLELWRVPEAE
jgi:hypothetical protein